MAHRGRHNTPRAKEPLVFRTPREAASVYVLHIGKGCTYPLRSSTCCTYVMALVCGSAVHLVAMARTIRATNSTARKSFVIQSVLEGTGRGLCSWQASAMPRKFKGLARSLHRLAELLQGRLKHCDLLFELGCSCCGVSRVHSDVQLAAGPDGDVDLCISSPRRQRLGAHLEAACCC